MKVLFSVMLYCTVLEKYCIAFYNVLYSIESQLCCMALFSTMHFLHVIYTYIYIYICMVVYGNKVYCV